MPYKFQTIFIITFEISDRAPFLEIYRLPSHSHYCMDVLYVLFRCNSGYTHSVPGESC